MTEVSGPWGIILPPLIDCPHETPQVSDGFGVSMSLIATVLSGPALTASWSMRWPRNLMLNITV